MFYVICGLKIFVENCYYFIMNLYVWIVFVYCKCFSRYGKYKEDINIFRIFKWFLIFVWDMYLDRFIIGRKYD